MPTYEYECDSCGHHLEAFQSMFDEPLKKCPVCKKSKLKRLLGTGAGIIFKGNGFYETDYRSDSYKSAEKKEKSEGETSTVSSAKSESKTESKKPSAKKNTDSKSKTG